MQFGKHLPNQIDKANKTTKELARLMPRMEGPNENKRRLLMNVVHSIILYGVEVWCEVFNIKKYRKMAERTQRMLCLKISRGYRTIGIEPVRVIARVIPIHLMAEERVRQAKGGVPKKTSREITMNCWQEIWSGYKGSEWTRRLIPKIEEWYNRKFGNIDYHLTQMLSGHGCFQSFLFAIKRAETPMCLYCNEEEETAEHTFTECSKWKERREEVKTKTGREITSNNLVQIMLESEDNWQIILNYTRQILEQKERDEKRRQRQEEFFR